MLINPVDAAKIAWHALRSRDQPLLAQIVVTRRCNLACAYCSEYDQDSDPVRLPLLLERIGDLARLRTLMVAPSGGEPLLHPAIDEVIREIRRHRMVAMITTNGYPLTSGLVSRLNRAGLQVMQVSIDNVHPDEISAKSLAVLDDKLSLLAERARFRVNVNSVLGASEDHAADVLAVARRARRFGFSHTVALVHDGSGLARPLSDHQREVYRQAQGTASAALQVLNRVLFQERVLHGTPDRWQCRAGARFLYVCEDGLVHWCSQRRPPAIPLAQYDRASIREAFETRKACSVSCTVTCVRQVSMFDGWRRRQRGPEREVADA
jgi:MoaA/NifB/PqqE/SkfB family radical SAM enzyme